MNKKILLAEVVLALFIILGFKAATVSNGAEIRVPLFINVGDKVKVDTRTGDYVERVSK